ncbi:hypothetical protein IGI37_001377 [Enterococcus sp. AZ194]|uniref:SpaA isopeptide-forming pilin-related protein n=1 Tax=Enterococcus sp. AZ194 TaxID=2774629 RepID=UPI003F276D5D
MRKKRRVKQIVAVLLPMLVLLGIVFTFPKGNSLQADDSEQPFATVKLAGKTTTLTDVSVKEETVEVELVGKKDELIQLPDDEAYELSQLDEEGNPVEIPEIEKTELDEWLEQHSSKASETQETSETAQTSTETSTSEELEEARQPELFHVTGEDGKGVTYLQVMKDEPLRFVVQRQSEEKTPIVLKSTEKEKTEQSLFSFEERSTEKEKTSETSKSTTKTAGSSESKANEPTNDSSSETKEKVTPPKIEESEDTEKYENVQFVETKATKKSLDELRSEEYDEEDSLRTPKFLPETKAARSGEIDSNGTIGIRDAKIVVKTGTASFDSDNNPGHDKDATNDIVRSFDQIMYLVSFSVQNESKETQYSNIKYQVISTLPRSLKNENGTFVNIGEIANGTSYPSANDELFSEGVMESVISDTGQIFVPVSLSVYGPKHGTVIAPKFKLRIIEATNKATGEVETIEKVYDSDKLPGLSTPETKVSAKSSVSVQLVQGDIKTNTVFGSSNTNEGAYDVAAVTTLKPIAGRTTGDYRGSTYPSTPITYTIKQSGTFQKGATTGNLSTSQFNPFYMESYAPAVKERIVGEWKNSVGGKTSDVSQFKRALSAPHAKSYIVFTQQPLRSDKSEIGVFDSGEFTITRNGNVSNQNYAAVYNPYTYLMTGQRSPSATDKSFSSLEMIFSWDKKRTADLAAANGWSRYDMKLSIDSVTYDGSPHTNSSSVSYPNLSSPSGGYNARVSIMNEQLGGYYGVPGLPASSHFQNATPGGSNVYNYGNAQISKGSGVWFTSHAAYGNGPVVKGSQHLLMWDSTAFKFRTEYYPEAPYSWTWSIKNLSPNYKFGVVKNGKLGQTPPYTMIVNKIDVDSNNLYDWYDTPQEAESHGDISAVLYTAQFDHDATATGEVQHWFAIPLTVIAMPGDKTPAGNPIVALGSQKFVDKDGKALANSVINGTAAKTGNGNTLGYGTYKPTSFQSNGFPPLVGGVYQYPMEYWNHLGESAFVKKMTITTKTDVKKSLYQSHETIDVKVNAVLNTPGTGSYDASVTTILPKGVSYKQGTSKDAYGNSVENKLQIINNPDETTTLKWTFPKASTTDGIEIHFQCTLDQTKLPYLATGYTENLLVKTVGNMWVNGNPNVKDESVESLRSSSDTFMVQRMQQVVLSKNANKPLIEVGNTDPVGTDTSITYEVTLLNESLDDIVDGRLLDVLPFDNDGRGTKFSGNYTVTNVQVTGPSPTISFSNSSMAYDTDPNTLSGWVTYKPGVDPVTKVKDAKAILVSVPKLAVDEKVVLKITIQPKDQKAGDVLVNNAQMNSQFDLQVNSQAVWTRVHGRDLSGVAWYDDNYDGLIGNMANGTPEAFAKDIPVKLYRTSLDDPSYQDKLVKESLTGESLIDTNGDSLVKTDANGKYKFSNLPEGTYVAEFIVRDRVVRKEVQVTTADVGDDPTKNSKASQSTHKTPDYHQPILSDLPDATTPADPTYHITDVNIGLIRASRIRLFKYQTGTVVDANNDGIISDVEKATGTPIPGAEFTIYHEGVAQGTATTDETGFLLFDFFFRGDYTLIETKAPDGYELIKHDIPVTIKEGNETIILYQENDRTTDLPFTGGNGPARLFLLVSGSIFLLGLLGIAWHYRTPKKKGAA